MRITGSPIGLGNTADVYDIGDSKVVKLFHAGYPEDAVRKEFGNSQLVNGLDIPAPKSYEVVTIDGRDGIVYDKVSGECMQDALLRSRDLERYATLLAQIHRRLLEHSLPEASSRMERLHRNIESSPILTGHSKAALVSLLAELPGGDAFCHGDFHFGNVLLDGDGYTVIDFMDVTKGHPHCDIARTVYLIEMTPAPDGPEKERIRQIKKDLACIYLNEMGVVREDIATWLLAIAAARLSELWPGQQEERDTILAYLQNHGY